MYQLLDTPILFILVFSALVISLAIHEFAHAYSADKLGDPTAKYLGRLTLNPLAHLDPVGTLLLVFAGFGWGKPVPVDSTYFSNPKRDMAIVAFAGPLSNFILAIVSALILHLFPVSGLIGAFLYLFITYNLLLGLFNLIPLHPLDGFKVVLGILPNSLAIQWLQVKDFGVLILLVLVFTQTTSKVLNPLLQGLLSILGLQSI